MLFVFNITTLLFMLWLFMLWLWKKLWSLYLLNKKALECMCLIYKQYLCYVQNVVWILNLYAIFVQANPQGGQKIQDE